MKFNLNVLKKLFALLRKKDLEKVDYTQYRIRFWSEALKPKGIIGMFLLCGSFVGIYINIGLFAPIIMFNCAAGLVLMSFDIFRRVISDSGDDVDDFIAALMLMMATWLLVGQMLMLFTMIFKIGKPPYIG